MFDGAVDGFNVGRSDGFLEGVVGSFKVGRGVGCWDGVPVGFKVGACDGFSEGFAVGFEVGGWVGCSDGVGVGFGDGGCDGLTEGAIVGLEVCGESLRWFSILWLGAIGNAGSNGRCSRGILPTKVVALWTPSNGVDTDWDVDSFATRRACNLRLTGKRDEGSKGSCSSAVEVLY